MRKIICVLLALLMCAAVGCTVTQNTRPAQNNNGGKTVLDVLSGRLGADKSFAYKGRAVSYAFRKRRLPVFLERKNK